MASGEHPTTTELSTELLGNRSRLTVLRAVVQFSIGEEYPFTIRDIIKFTEGSPVFKGMGSDERARRINQQLERLCYCGMVAHLPWISEGPRQSYRKESEDWPAFESLARLLEFKFVVEEETETTNT